MGINIFFFFVYVLAYFANLNNTVAYKFADSVKDITDKAQVFQTQAGEGISDGFLAKAVVASALQFRNFGESLVTATEGSCDLLKTHAQAFAGAVGEFKNKAKGFSTAANGGSGFLNKAEEFQQAANDIPDITTKVETKNETVLKPSKVQDAIKIFKLAASVFGGEDGAAKKFQEFAQELQQKASQNEGENQGTNQNCYKLFGMIDKLKAEATKFQQKAGEFASAAGDFGNADAGQLVANFKAIATAFKDAADKSKDLADDLATGLADTELKSQAQAFKEKVDLFHSEAQEFEVVAKLVQEQDNTDLNAIKANFANQAGKLAHTFGYQNDGSSGETISATNSFNAITTINSCTELTKNAKAFKQAVDNGSNGFKQLADEFQRLASEIGDVDSLLNGNQPAKDAIQKFKDAALKFGKQAGDDGNTVAGKLNAFADALNTQAGTKCYKLLMHADKFQAASDNFTVYARLFRAAAAAFKAKATEFGAAYAAWDFREAATSFYDATSYLKTLADQLENDLSGTVLQQQAHNFQSKVVAFYNDSRLFYNLAQQVTDDKGLKDTGIPAAFMNAAQEFSKAAEQFGNTDPQGNGTVYKAFNAFSNALQSAVSKDCTALQTKANEFKEAATTFQSQAKQFKNQVEAIKDITVQVTYLKDIKVAGQTVATDEGTATIKPSKVQSAISQFKLSATKFLNAASIFKLAADTFGKDDQNSAADILETFATHLKTNGCDKGIKTNAEAFQTAADTFAAQAGQGQSSNGFQYLANQVNSFSGVNNLDSIKTNFLAAADKFVEAANAFNDAAQAFSDILTL